MLVARFCMGVYREATNVSRANKQVDRKGYSIGCRAEAQAACARRLETSLRELSSLRRDLVSTESQSREVRARTD